MNSKTFGQREVQVDSLKFMHSFHMKLTTTLRAVIYNQK